MTDENKELTTPFLEDTDSCCSKASCCAPQNPVKRVSPKVGRNEPCPCGSDRKFKKCCGQ